MTDIKDKLKVIHQTGKNSNIDDIKSRYASSRIEADVFEFSDRIWEDYAKADLVVARSGAATVAELSALSIPSVLVPYPYAADDHQRANAKALVDIGGAIMVDDKECTGARLALIIREMMNKPEELIGMKQSLLKLDASDAAKNIVARCIDILGS